MISLINIILALLAAAWFARRARATGKDAVRWALYGAGAYFIPALILTGLLAGIWRRSVLLALVPLEIQFYTTGQVVYPLLMVLLPAVVVGWIVTLHVFCTALSGETARRMNERTYAFEAAAVLLALVGWLAGPGLPRAASSGAYVGRPVFADFTDPTGVISLEVVRYDAPTRKLVKLQVSKDAQGVFAIPSHKGYPADAVEHLAEVARSFKGLNIINVATEDAQLHATYDVIEPTESNKGAPGVGMKVTLVDRDQKPYSLVIGKEASEQFGQRYVRVADQAAVLQVKLQTQMFSTDFGDWIEKNLLKVDTQEIMSIAMADYFIDSEPVRVRQGNQVFEVGARPVPKRRGRMIVEAMDSPSFSEPGKPEAPRWKLVESKVEKDQKWVDAPLAPDEELDASKLDALKYDLRGLAIVDVDRKKEALAKSLRERGTLPPTSSAQEEVSDYGFYMVPVTPENLEYLRTFVPAKDKTVELLSGQGDLRVATKDGIVYVLRFGDIASSEAVAAKGKKEPAKQEAGKKAPAKKEAGPEGEKKAGEAASGGENVNRFLFILAEFDPSQLPQPQVLPLPELPKPEPAKPDAAKAKPEAAKPEAGKKEEPKKPDPEALRKQIEAQRTAIEAANKKSREDFDAKVEAGKKKVQELNERFANWFYIIPDSEYQKIHLGRKDIIKKKEAPKKEPTEKPVPIPGIPEIPGLSIPPSPPPAAAGAKKEAPAAKTEAPPAKKEAPPAKKEAPTAKKEAAPAAKKESPPAVKPEAAAAKKESSTPPAKKESPPAAPKKESPPAPVKKDAPAPPPKPAEPDGVKT